MRPNGCGAGEGPCTELHIGGAIGAHVGHNAQATEAVRADVMAFLTATLLK